MNNEVKYFNIRVYGILKNPQGEILLSDEYVLDKYMTKFPGGGLKFGEGPEDCIQREGMEEFGQEIEIIGHYYTTGFYQKALFYEDHQLISIYYLIKLKQPPKFKISYTAFDFEGEINGSQSFRWAHPSNLDEHDLSFPIDRYVLRLLKNE